MGGDAILFVSDRYGMRSQASWGAQYDALLVFTNRAAYDRFRLSPEDFALQKELKEARKKKEAEKDKKIRRIPRNRKSTIQTRSRNQRTSTSSLTASATASCA